MTAKYIASALIVLGMAGTDIGAAEMARLPAAAGAIAPSSPLPRDLIEHASGADGSRLSENSWDFTKPESIPGFGPLPPGYDTRPLLPRFSGSD